MLGSWGYPADHERYSFPKALYLTSAGLVASSDTFAFFIESELEILSYFGKEVTAPKVTGLSISARALTSSCIAGSTCE